jgi:hypothetical protein
MCTNFQKVENIMYTSLRFKVRFKIYYKEYIILENIDKIEDSLIYPFYIHIIPKIK